MNPQTRNYTLISVLSFVIFAILLTMAIFASTLGYIKTYPWVIWVLVGPGAVSLTLAIAFLMRALSLRSINRLALDEARYYFGEEILFYNFAAFERKTRVIRHHHKSEQAYVIAFTASKVALMQNHSHSDNVTKYNGLIAHWLQTYFGQDIKNRFNVSFGFYQGCFLVVLYGTEGDLTRTISDIEDAFYEIERANNIRLFVQPLFGIATLAKEDDLVTTIGHALLARETSEKNFESQTFFNANLESHTNSSDIEMIIDALRDKEFVVYYQPKFSLKERRFVTSEALVRLNSKKYGLVSPAKFITQATEAGLLHDLDMYVFEHVCMDLVEAKKRGRRLIPVSVNFSLDEFFRPTFFNEFDTILRRYEVDPHLIEIEIVEGVALHSSFLSGEMLKRFRALGIRISLDDFGVGFSNFNSLKKLPIDSIKIDKSFIDDIAKDPKAMEIVRFLISFCAVNGYESIAEGVDNQQQIDLLRRVKCDTIQGFYYSAPIPFEAYHKFLIDNPFEKKGGK